LKRLTELEAQIALDLHAKGVNQSAIARVLKKLTARVNDLMQEGRNS
jgi:transcriptional regulator